MTQRRDSVERTKERILEAAYAIWLERPYDQVTLDAVAAAAGVSRQTVLRHFGSKDDLALAVVAWQRPIEEHARAAEPGDVATAVHRLVERYETMGDANVRILELEGRVAPIDRLLTEARESHRGWIERTFAPWIRTCRGARREQLVLALYAATDVTVWKLLRRDLGAPRDRVEAIIRQLLEGVLPPLEAISEETRP